MAQMPKGPEHLYCPYWRRKMSSVCHVCPKWMEVRGTHPQTGADVSDWHCSDTVSAMVAIEQVRATRGAQAATESLRNEIVKRSDIVTPPVIKLDASAYLREIETTGGTKLINGGN